MILSPSAFSMMAMLWIDLDESLLVHVYAGKLEVKPAAEELLVAWPIQKVSSRGPVDRCIADATFEQGLRLAFVFITQHDISGWAGIKKARRFS